MNSVAAKKQWKRQLTQEEWLIVESLRDLLNPFLSATKLLEAGKTPTISFIVPVIFWLFAKLQNAGSSSHSYFLLYFLTPLVVPGVALTDCRKIFFDSLKKRFSHLFQPEAIHLLLPVVFDPRTKALSHIPDLNRTYILSRARAMVDSRVEPSAAQEARNTASLLDFYMDHESVSGSVRFPFLSPLTYCILEMHVFDKYLATPADPRSDPGQWFADRPEFDVIFQLYREHNCSPGAAVDVERLWSDGGQLDHPLRSRMHPDNLSNRLFYKQNSPLLADFQ